MPPWSSSAASPGCLISLAKITWIWRHGFRLSTLKRRRRRLVGHLSTGWAQGRCSSWRWCSTAWHGLSLQGTPPCFHQTLYAKVPSTTVGFNPAGKRRKCTDLTRRIVMAWAICVLVGTAEIPLAALHADDVLPASVLPRRYAAFGHCFRAEAGGPGAESRGLYRVHQFSKVEMFCISTEDDSDAQLEALLAQQMALCDELGLHYRVLDMPTLELGAPAYRKYDIEAWMPGRNAFGEICSASNCTDYQSRRFGIRYRDETDGKPRFAHTLNATAIAVPRIVLALLENGQQSDGSVILPECLVPFMHGTTTLTPPETAL
eukprot:m.217078 g.217078  ORF g.217078 m.217078 type:complete len:318 (+) comp28855_c0_seq1:486-1439(+)